MITGVCVGENGIFAACRCNTKLVARAAMSHKRQRAHKAPLFTGVAGLSSPMQSWLFAALADARSLKSPFRVRLHYGLPNGKNQSLYAKALSVTVAGWVGCNDNAARTASRIDSKSASPTQALAVCRPCLVRILNSSSRSVDNV